MGSPLTWSLVIIKKKTCLVDSLRHDTKSQFLCLRNEMPVIPLNLQFIVLYMFGT